MRPLQRLTVIVPVFNEAAGLPAFWARISVVLDTLADTSAGLLVIVPHQGHIALVEDALTGAITAGPSLLMIAAEASAIAPRPASSGLFVYWRSRFHPVEVRPAPDGGVALVPPPQIASEIIRAQESPAT